MALLRSMPFRLAMGLVALFSVVSLISLAASYVVTQRSFDQAMRADLMQDMAGFRAAPTAAALAALVEAEARETDPARMVLSYSAPGLGHFGNAMIARDDDGYRIVSVTQGNAEIDGRFLSLTASLWGGQLTVARSRGEIDALRDVFLNILALSLVPTILIALSGGLYLARRSARQVRIIGKTLDQLTSGNLAARVGPTRGWSDDLARIGEKLDQMAEAQETSVAAIRQVSSDIAHDLKTPIQRVAVHLDDLLRQDDLPDRAVVLLEKATDQLDGVVSVFHSLLQIAQIETGSPRNQFRAVDLVELARTFCEIYEPSASDKGQHLVFIAPDAPSLRVWGDRNLLGQVLANLIENALRHTDAGARIEVGLRHHGQSICLWVADDGPGIPAVERDRVLRRLYRLDRSRTTPGNGLGLSLVASIAALHQTKAVLLDNGPGLRVEITFAEVQPDPASVPTASAPISAKIEDL
ncbi:two-component sensor histidine kinase [Pseudoruegeria sp. SK021]|nr:two-component sensor histidine kinase [Pseudoruegeria sp. SK021]